MIPCLLPLCLFASTAQAPQDAKAGLEVLPLQDLCSLRLAVEPPIWGSLLRQPNVGAQSGSQHDLLLLNEVSQPFEPDHVVQMLSHLNQADVDGGRLDLSRQGDTLFVHGEPATVGRCKQQVDEASAKLMRPLQIEVCVWDATDRELTNAVLGPREYAQFTANLTPLWRRIASTRSGGAVELAKQRWTRYVYDVDPEVAQKQTICKPVTDAYCEGGSVVVRPHLLVGGDDLVLHVQFGLAQRRGIVRSVPTGMPGAPDIELPLLETIFGTCSGRLVNGGALVVSLRGNASSGGQLALTVRASAKQPPSNPAMAGVGIYPCSALTSLALTQLPALPPHPRLYSTADFVQEANASFGCIAEDQLTDLVRSALGPGAEDSVAISTAGGYVFVRGEPAAQTTVETLLRALQDRLLRNATVRHVARLQAADADASGATATTPLLHELVLPTLLGRVVTAARLLETNIVSELGASIAQEASILDPTLEALQVGTWLQARLAPAGKGLHLLFSADCVQAAQPPLRSVMPAGGVLMPTELASVRSSHDGPVTSGQAVEHGDGPNATIDGRGYRSTLTTTINW